MTCVSPLTAYWSKEFGKSGKRGVTFDRNSSFSGVPFQIGCGQCIECRASYAQDWATRLMHERKSHPEAWFLSLTYSKHHLPANADLSKMDLHLFMHRLRKSQRRKYGRKIRFFACGEYGDVGNRPHYHAIVFNMRIPDLVFYKRNARGDPLWSSKYVEGVWNDYGMCTVGDVTYDSAHYVAKYGLKRVTGVLADEHYMDVDPDGLIFTRTAEFSRKSNRPGIGYEFFQKYYKEIYASDSCIMSGKEVPVPKYYDMLYERLDSEKFALVKRGRLRRAYLLKKNFSVDRRRAGEVIKLRQLAARKRGVA